MDPRSPAELTGDLRRLGVRTGDTVMVHASMRAIGPVEGGAAGVVAAIDAAVGPEGTSMMTLGALDPAAAVNERPEPARRALLAGTEPFDALRTPADPDVGVLAEVFRTSAGTLVSDHPEGRFGARGRHAAAVVADVPWDDYYGPGSPLDRFVAAGGRVLRLGADPDTVTLIHLAEARAAIPSKRRVRRHRLVAGAGGAEVRVVETWDDSDGVVDLPGEDYFAVILRAFLDDAVGTGHARVGTVGGARAELLDGAALVEHAVAWLERAAAVWAT